MAKVTYYAVKTGKVPGIYRTWAECEAQTKGFSGAEFKKFGTEEAAQAFIDADKAADSAKSAPDKAGFTIPDDMKFGRGTFTSMSDSNLNLTEYYELPYTSKTGNGKVYVSENGNISVARDGVDHRYLFGEQISDSEQAAQMTSLLEKHSGYKMDNIIEAARINGDIARDDFEKDMENSVVSDRSRPVSNTMHIYVDGSYNADTKNYGYGVYMYKGDGKDPQIFTGSAPCKANGRNVEGEIQAARVGLWNAKLMGVKEAVVYHDYDGVGAWADGAWRANKDYTRDYSSFVNNLREMGMSIKFKHVDGHTGDKGNEYVDKLAKIACGVPITASEKAFVGELKGVPGYPNDDEPVRGNEFDQPASSVSFDDDDVPF